MHGMKAPGGTQFFFNGDYSGEVIFTAKMRDADATVDVEIPMQDILALAGYVVRGNMVSRLEQMGDIELLNRLSTLPA